MKFLNTASLSKDELEIQDKREEFLFIQKNSIEKAKREGIEQGRENEKIEIAKNLLDILDNEMIALKTGLDIETVEALR